MEQEPLEGAETRSRARSRTPGLSLRVSTEKEINGTTDKKIVKSPGVTTVMEEVVKITDGDGTGTKTLRQTRTVTSDYSSDDKSPVKTSSLSKSSTVEKTSSVTVTRTSSNTSPITKNIKETKSTFNSSQQSPIRKEVRQNEINRVLEDKQTATIRTSTPKISSKVQKKITLTPEELKQHAAYKEYKDAGEYWNKYPKTDYTYSELSPHRREIAPGMIAMPNMSRPGLSKHAERVNFMIQREPAKESYIRQRYAASKYASYTQADPYDSADEQLDLASFSKSTSLSRHQSSYHKSSSVHIEEHRSIISRFFLSIVNLFYGVGHSVSRVFNRSEHNMYYTRIEDERGLLLKIYSFFNVLLTGIFKRVYLLISSVLFLDTWLLQTASSDVQQGRRKRKFLLILLMLLPFLLFGGIYLYLDPTPLQSLRENFENPLLNYDLKLELPDTEAAKAFALEKWDGARQFTEYYLENIKLFSENAIGEIQKIWQENVNNLF